MSMKETRLRILPEEAYNLLFKKGGLALQNFGYPVSDHFEEHSWTWAYPAGLLMSQWLGTRGIDCDFTPPRCIARSLWQSNFEDWHLLSDDLVYALNLACRVIQPTGFLANEVLRRRRSVFFRSWRRVQRQAEWVRQRLFHGAPHFHKAA